MCILRYRNIFTFTFQIGHADKMEIIELRLQNSRYQAVVEWGQRPVQARVQARLHLRFIERREVRRQ